MNNKIKENIGNILRATGIGFIGGLLGAWGGADGTSKAWRRVGLTLLYTAYAYYKLRNIWVLTVASVFIPLTFGYGVPDETDDGSTLGKFFYKIFKNSSKRHLLTDVFVRGSISFMILLSVVSVPVLRNAWVTYLLYGAIMTIAFTTISWRGLGTVQFMKKDLLLSEVLTWSITTLAIYKIIG